MRLAFIAFELDRALVAIARQEAHDRKHVIISSDDECREGRKGKIEDPESACFFAIENSEEDHEGEEHAEANVIRGTTAPEQPQQATEGTFQIAPATGERESAPRGRNVLVSHGLAPQYPRRCGA